MEKLGADGESIHKATGWHKGADGKWRFEIDDSGMKFYKDGDARLMEEDGYRRLKELTDKWVQSVEDGTELSAEESAEMERLQEEYSERVWEEKYNLTDFVKHDELFEQYPKLRGVSLVFKELSGGEKGYFEPWDNTIVLSDLLFGKEPDVVLHEIQHVIQEEEGFSGGSSPMYWAKLDAETGAVKKRIRMERAEIFRNMTKEEQNDYTRYKELERELERLENAEDGTEDGDRYVRYDRESDELYLKLWGEDWFQKLVTLDRKLESGLGEEYNRLYYNTAGEIEARDTANRRTLTAEERRNRMPDTGNENTVLAEDAEGGYSIEEDGDRAYQSGVDNETDGEYNERADEGGITNGREMGDDIRGRVSAQMSGEQSATGDGEYRADETGVYAKRRTEGDAGQDVLDTDSEGRELTEEQVRELRGTAIVDEAGAPLAVYHFTPEMEFDTFAKGDIGFHFGTQEQAAQRGKDLNAENGRTFRAHLNIKNPYRIRLDLNAWWPSHIGLYLWSEGVLTDAQWNEIQNLDGRGYDTPGATRLREMLDNIGIDGFAYPNAVEGDGDSYIALRDEQIVRSDILTAEGERLHGVRTEGGDAKRLDLKTYAETEAERYSVSEDKEDILRNLRGILSRGGDAKELKRYVNSLEQEESDFGRVNLKTYGETEAERILDTAHGQGLSVDEYLRQNWELYECAVSSRTKLRSSAASSFRRKCPCGARASRVVMCNFSCPFILITPRRFLDCSISEGKGELCQQIQIPY